MRKIVKKLSTKTVDVLVYDTVAKCEKIVTVNMLSIDKVTPIPENCAFISKTTVSVSNMRYTMTPQEFVLHAKAEPIAETTK